MEKEQVTHAAIKYQDGAIFLASRHSQILARRAKEGIETKGNAIQGFWTSRDRFVRREQAAKIATRAGQVEKPTSYLFSEDCLPFVP